MDTVVRYYESRETTHYHVLPAVEIRCFCFDCTDTVARKCMVFVGSWISADLHHKDNAPSSVFHRSEEVACSTKRGRIFSIEKIRIRMGVRTLEIMNLRRGLIVDYVNLTGW